MDDDKSVTANFAIKTCSLTVTANNGSVTKSPSASSYDCGTVVSLTANPNTGWHFVRWEGDASGTATSASVTMSADRSVTAIFEEDIPDTYTLTKTVSPSSGGAISASPDKSVYTDGESVTLTANPEACYDFTGWSGACSGTSLTCTLSMNADKSVTANFAVKTHSVSITANNGTVTKSPNQSSYDCGTTVLLTAEPDDCYDFIGWSGACSGTNSTCSLTTDADKSVIANFAVRTYSLNITALNGSVTKSPNQSTYNCGTGVTLTANPNTGYHFVRWEGDTSGTASTATLDMSDDRNVTAIFEEDAPNTFTLTKNLSPSSGGTISTSPDQSVYEDGESVTLSAEPADCHEFTGWSGACSGTSPTCTLTMDADKSATANFAIKTYSLDITAENGSVTKNPSASVYDCGTSVSLTAVPNPGYEFDHWEGDIAGSQTDETLAMNQDRSVTAIFISADTAVSFRVWADKNGSRNYDTGEAVDGAEVWVNTESTARGLTDSQGIIRLDDIQDTDKIYAQKTFLIITDLGEASFCIDKTANPL